MTARQLTRWTLFGGLGVIAMVVLAACGGGSSTPSAPGGAAPGGGASGGSAPGLGAPGGGGTGSDAKYMSELCKASKTFTDDLAKVTKDSSKTDPNDIDKLMAAPFEAFAKSVSKAKPPSDLKDYHNQMVKWLNDYVQQLKSGTASSDTSPNANVPEPPQAVMDRMKQAAAKNSDCAGSGFFGQ